MQVKTISYKRVLNLGNYENKHLELSAEVFEGDDVDEAISVLAEKVERKIREDAHSAVEQEISQLNKLLRELKKELREVEQEIAAAKSPQSEPELTIEQILLDPEVVATSDNIDDF